MSNIHDPRDSSLAGGARALFERMPQLGWVAEADGGITYYNRRWYEYTGTNASEVEGWGWQSVHDAAFLPRVLEQWRAALASGRPFEMSFPLRRHDGVFRWFKTVATPLCEADGQVVGWVGVNTDIDDQKQAEHRLEALAELSFALAGAVTVGEVAALIVEHGMRCALADTCTLYGLDETGGTLLLLGHRGVAPEVLDKVRKITRAQSGASPAFDTLASGESLWGESEQDYLALFPSIATTPSTAPRAKAFWSVPLVVEGQPLGLLGMGFYQERTFTAEERRFVETFVKQCAQALLRAQLRQRETAARQWLSTTLQSIGDAVITTDTDGRVTFMNAVAERLTGWREREARGAPLADVFAIYSEKTGEVVESPVTKVLREGTVVGLANHTILRARHGGAVPIHDSGAPIRDEKGELFGVVLVFRDVSEEKRAEKRRDFLARAIETLSSSLDYRTTLAQVAQLAVPELADWCAVDILEPKARAPVQLAVAHADPAKLAYARELGERYPPDPNAPTGVPQVIRSGKSELYVEIPAQLLEAAAKDAEHLRIIRELRLESAMVVPIPGRDGQTLGAMTFIYAESGRRYSEDDLSFAEDFARRAASSIENARALKDAEESRARERLLRREAELASTTKDEFLATASHELRTPLNAILGWTLTLRRRQWPADVERALGVIERNARAQTRLIEDVLDVSRIISGKLTLSRAPIDVAEIVTMSVEGIRPAAEAKGITLTATQVESALPMMADADRLQQVLWNLLTNAVKFTQTGGVIAVRAERAGSEVDIEVTDTGEGIPQEALEHIFEPFRQGDNSTTRRHGGLGLGLALVRQLVAAHGGTVHASSAGPGSGATFLVRLPAGATPPAAARPANDFKPMSPGPNALPRLDGLAVLIVDDEPDARDLVGEVLRERGAEVHFASSATEALERVKVLRVDVIVSDIGMPQVDGYALIRQVRSMPPSEGGRTPAVALTAYSRREDAQRAFAAGYQRHVAKPVEPSELVTVVANLGGRTLG